MRAIQQKVDSSLIDASAHEQEIESQITAHLPLVRKLAQQIHGKLPKGITEVDDLMSAGIFGLLEAVKRYEPSRQNSFETFAYTRIRGAIIDSLRADGSGSRTLRQRAKTVEQTVDQLSKSFGRSPTEAEVASSLGMTLPQYRVLVMEILSIQIVSLDSGVTRSKDSPGMLIDRIPDSSVVTPLALLEKKETNAQLVRAIESLPEREKRVVSLYYFREMTLKEIGAELGVMESYVSKIRARAILRLNAMMSGSAAPLSTDRTTTTPLFVKREAKRKALKTAHAEISAYNPIAAMKFSSAQ